MNVGIVPVLTLAAALFYGSCGPPAGRIHADGVEQIFDEDNPPTWTTVSGEQLEGTVTVATDVAETCVVDSFDVDPPGIVAVEIELGVERNRHPIHLEALAPGSAIVTVNPRTTRFAQDTYPARLNVVVDP